MENHNPAFLKFRLKDLCLNCITRNFDWFMLTYQAGDVPARNFEYLQRACSKELYKELAGTEHFLKYRDFLLNPHLKEIDLKLCHRSSNIRNTIERLKTIGDTITKLIFSGYCYTPHLLLEVPYRLPKVKSLTFHRTQITDDVLERIGKFCTDLETLNLPSCYCITDDGIKSLCPTEEIDGSVCKNKVLKHLDISSTPVTASGTAFVLNHFPNLVTIQHIDVITALYGIYCDIKNNPAKLFKEYKLQELVIHNDGRFMDVKFFRMCPLLCPNITKLTVMSIISQAHIDACVRFAKLKEVYFVLTFPSAELSSFVEARGNTLEVLQIKDGNISVKSLLKFCLKLKCLILENTTFKPLNEFTGDTLGQKFEKLKLLSLKGMNLGFMDVMKSANLILSATPILETLNFANTTSFSLEFVNSITKHECMRTLQEVDVSFSDIRYPAMKKLLLSTPNLGVCIMQYCTLSLEDYKLLRVLRPFARFDWRIVSNNYNAALFENIYDNLNYDIENDYDGDIENDYDGDIENDYDGDIENNYDIENDYDGEVDCDGETDCDIENNYDGEIDYDIENGYDEVDIKIDCDIAAIGDYDIDIHDDNIEIDYDIDIHDDNIEIDYDIDIDYDNIEIDYDIENDC